MGNWKFLNNNNKKDSSTYFISFLTLYAAAAIFKHHNKNIYTMKPFDKLKYMKLK